MSVYYNVIYAKKYLVSLEKMPQNEISKLSNQACHAYLFSPFNNYHLWNPFLKKKF